MIRCEARKGNSHVKVTFEIPIDDAAPVSVVGDFNNWDPVATPMARRGDTMLASLDIDTGRRYAFRYLADGGRWFNDEAADDYQPNDFGGKDSVVDLSAGGDRAPRR